MAAGSSAAGSGLVVGLCLVFLGQQFGFIDLSSLIVGLLYLVAFAVVFAIVFGLLGVWLGARYLRKHRELTAWQPKAAAPGSASSPAASSGSSDSSEPPTQ